MHFAQITYYKVIVIYIAVSISQPASTYDYHVSGSLYTRYFILTSVRSPLLASSLCLHSANLSFHGTLHHVYAPFSTPPLFSSDCSLSEFRNYFHSRSHSRSFLWIFGHLWQSPEPFEREGSRSFGTVRRRAQARWRRRPILRPALVSISAFNVLKLVHRFVLWRSLSRNP
jgi:hypothetical protein